MKYPNRIKELKKEKGMTGVMLARASSLSLDTIRSFETCRNDLTKASARTLYKLASALDVAIIDLFSEESELTKQICNDYIRYNTEYK